MSVKKLSIIIVTYNSSNEIEQVIQSILKTVYELDYEIIVVDNNSRDDTVSKISGISTKIRLISNKKNVGFANANNQGFQVAQGDFILILNPDIILTSETKLKDLCERLTQDRRIGIIAPRLNYSDGSIQESVRGFPSLTLQLIRMMKIDGLFRNSQYYRNYMVSDKDMNKESFVDWVIGAFMLIRKELLFEVGLFDKQYFMYMEDADLCVNLRKRGYKICYSPQFSAIHAYKRESSKGILSSLKWFHIISSIRFYLKHGYKNPHE